MEQEQSAKNRCNESKVLILSSRRVVAGDRRNRPLPGGMPLASSL